MVSKKKKRSSPKLRLLFRPQSEFQTFFPPKIRWFPKKKKRSSPKLRLIFWPKSDIQTFQGGLFSIFLKKSGSKPPKTCDFAYFISQWGGSSPPWLCYCALGFFMEIKYKLLWPPSELKCHVKRLVRDEVCHS